MNASCDPLAIDVRVAQRFNAYARAAYPREVGGLLRIVERDGRWTAVDLTVPAQRVNAARFVLDGVAVARWCLELDAAGHDAGEWRGIIHSHPSMPPIPSSVDIATLIEFAGDRFAFSVICSAYPQPRRNRYSCHYAQGAPLRLLACDIGIEPAGGATLAGITSLPRTELDAAAADVARLLTTR